MAKTLRLILGDQLSHNISSLKDCDRENDIVLMCEVMEEATYVAHHKKKIAFIFSAMRHFAEELKTKNYNIHYTKLDDPENAGSFKAEIERAIKKYKPQKISVTFPGEYRVLQDMESWEGEFGIPVEIIHDDRFLCTPKEYADWAKDRRNLRMELFYHDMRRRYQVLMDHDHPEGGKWNYDNENRKMLDGGLFVPKTAHFELDDITRDVINLVARTFPGNFGDLEPFHYAVTRQDAFEALELFIEQRLPLFGDYQDAMLQNQPWLYHSHISFYMNSGLLEPLEVIRAAELAYYAKRAPLNAVEGFIRQILGWREYIRGVYWLKMPEYADKNFLNATRKLPQFYWDTKTDMNCLHHCVKDTKEHAYAHHIQRLMVLGNFALIAGIDPQYVNEWYLIVYADAYEWVELPNVSGMILYADGGYLGSKPYAASGAYINKMSDYCGDCRFKVSKKEGPDACPFNYLYWDFMIRNAPKLQHNPRLNFTYRALAGMKPDKIKQIKKDSEAFLNSLIYYE